MEFWNLIPCHPAGSEDPSLVAGAAQWSDAAVELPPVRGWTEGGVPVDGGALAGAKYEAFPKTAGRATGKTGVSRPLLSLIDTLKEEKY